MAYTVGTAASNSAAGSNASIATTTTISVSTGDTIVVFLSAAQNQTAAFSASDGTNTYTLRTDHYNASADITVGILVCENATAGTYTVTGSWSGTRTSNAVFAVPISGLKAASYQTSIATAQASPGTSTDGVTTGNMTPTEQPGCVIGFALCSAALSTPAAGTGYTSAATVWDYGFGTPLTRVMHKRITSTADVALTATAGSNVNHFSGAVILSEATGVSFVPRGTLLGVG